MLQQLWERHQRWLKVIPWILLVASFLYGLLGDQGIYRLYELKGERLKLEASVKTQQDINTRLRREVYYLRHDPNYIEKLAREEMGLVRPGEVVYQFKDE